MITVATCNPGLLTPSSFNGMTGSQQQATRYILTCARKTALRAGQGGGGHQQQCQMHNNRRRIDQRSKKVTSCNERHCTERHKAKIPSNDQDQGRSPSQKQSKHTQMEVAETHARECSSNWTHQPTPKSQRRRRNYRVQENTQMKISGVTTTGKWTSAVCLLGKWLELFITLLKFSKK